MTALQDALARPRAGARSRELIDLLRLSVPMAFVQLGLSAMGFVDTAMAGRMSDLAQGATGLGSSLFFGVSVVALGLVLGLDPLTSQAFGAGKPRQARRTLWQGVYAAALLTVPACLVMAAFGLLLERFGVEAELAAQTRLYLWARLPSLLPFLFVVALRAYLQSAHATRAIVVSTIVANLFNFGANALLGFGDEALVAVGLPQVGLPALGVAGLALASSFASAAQVAVLALAVRAIPAGEGDEPLRAWHAPILRAVLSLGWPIALTLFAEVGVFVLAQVLIAGMGVQAAAAHQVALQFASLTFSICLGIGAATSVQVGRAIGAGDSAKARRAGLTGMTLAAGFMCLPGLVMGLGPELLLPLMTEKDGIVPLASRLLGIAAVFQLADGVQAVASGALRGAGITRWAFVANVLAHWAVGLPVGLVLGFGLGWGAAGIWWGLTAGLIVVAASLAVKFAVVTRRGVAAVVVR